MERCGVFIGVDSGPMHLASAVGIRCACVFSAHDRPGVWFPFGLGHQVVYHQTDCFGCRLKICVEQAKRCITSVTVDEMISATMAAIDLRRPTDAAARGSSPNGGR